MSRIKPSLALEFAQFAPIEQLNILLKQSLAAFAATMAVLLYILFWVSSIVDTKSLLWWTGAIIALNIYLLIWVYFVNSASKNNLITTQTANRFIAIYQVQAILHGLSWGILPFLLADLTAPEMKFFAYIVLCGLAAGAIGTTAMIYRIYLSFMLPLMLPVLITQLFFPESFNLFGRSTLELLIIFVISLLVLSHTYYESIKRSIILMLENKHLLNDVTVTLKKAEAASDAKSHFLANMSHELRTPLNVIMGYSELIKESFAANELNTIPGDADKIHNSGQHLLSLINNILDLTKIEAGKMDVHVEDIKLSYFLKEIKETTKTLVKKNNNDFIIDSLHDVTMIKSDVTKLRQIFLNIISNASKFTQNGTITINVITAANNVQVSISDTGIGMNSDQLADLKTPFTQADISTTKKYGGTGLGMSLTDLLTKLLGIKLDVSSTPNKGTCFKLVIPIEYKPQISQHETALTA